MCQDRGRDLAVASTPENPSGGGGGKDVSNLEIGNFR